MPALRQRVMNRYIFHVSIPGSGRVWRKLELLGSQTLAELHHAIQNAFDFGHDHLYSFFMSGKAWDRHSEYSLPEGVTPYDDLVFIDEEGNEVPLDDDDEDEENGADEPEPTPEEREAALRELFGPGPSLAEMEAFMETFWAKQEAYAAAEAKRDVRVVTLDSLDLDVGQTFLYLFDYGDEWRFRVRVHALAADTPADGDYPRVVESVGKAPAQYGNWDDE